MTPGDEWKEESLGCVTPQDMLKFCRTQSVVLLEPQFSFCGPIEVAIINVANGGELFKAKEISKDYSDGLWYRTKDVRILTIIGHYDIATSKPQEVRCWA